MGNLRITDNDLILYRYLFEQDFLTREHIKNWVWKDLSNSHIDNRLARLTKEGYLKKHPDLSAGMGTVLMAGSKAVGLLNNDYIIERMMDLKSSFINKESFIRSYTERDSLNYARYSHDEYLTDIRFKLEGLVDEFLSYRLLMVYNKNAGKDKKFTKPTPDAIMRRKNDVFAIELENTLKESWRYQQNIFEGYRNNHREKIEFVLYICTSQSIAEGINKEINKFTSPNMLPNPRLLVVEYDKVMKAKNKFIAMNYRELGNKIDVKDKVTFNFR
ncbi:MAG: hypothetical protein ACOCRO_10735 [Halanaerobiales bacterium]